MQLLCDIIKALTINTAEALYHADLGASINRTNPFTKKHDTVSQFTDYIVTLKYRSSSIELNDDNAITMTIIYQ